MSQQSQYMLWTAIGTVGAVVLALGVALVQATVAIVLSVKRRRLARRKVASLVSAWVEYTYAPSQRGDYYRRTVSLHLANESDEPVFKVEVLCGIATQDGVIQLGPLSAPRIIPVLPPKREFVYDVTMGMLAFGEYAHDTLRGLVAEVGFRDHENRRWERNFDGNLQLVKKSRPKVINEADDDIAFAQAGPIDNPYNPITTVLRFKHLADDEKVDDEQFHQHLVDEASGWRKNSADDIAAFRGMLRTASMPTHVWYLTPRIAYIRLLDELPDNANPQPAHVLTLVWRNGLNSEDRGWMLFGQGPYQPWMIAFTPGELKIDPLDEREQP